MSSIYRKIYIHILYERNNRYKVANENKLRIGIMRYIEFANPNNNQPNSEPSFQVVGGDIDCPNNMKWRDFHQNVAWPPLATSFYDSHDIQYAILPSHTRLQMHTKTHTCNMV